MEVCAFTKLNKLLSSLSVEGAHINAQFLCGHYSVKLKEALQTLAPNGKVLLVSKEDTFLEYSKELLSLANEVNCKLINIVLDNSSNTIENSSVLFSVPEDIRAVIVLDGALYDVVSYFASIKNLPVIVIPTKLNIFGVLNSHIFIRANGSLDKVKLSAKRYVILDNDLMFKGGDIAKFYASIVSKCVALFDYKIYITATQKQFNKKAYDLFRNGVLFAVGLTHKHVITYKNRLVEQAFIMEVASYLSDGEIYSCSSEKVVGRLACKNKEYLTLTEFFASMTLINIYGEFFKSYNSIYSIVDYTARTEYVTKNLNIDNNQQVLNSFLTQAKCYRENAEELNKLLKSIYQGAQMVANNSEKIVKRFYLLGGTELDENKVRKLKQAIRYAGDYPYGFNGGTLLREKGVLDIIN